MTENHTKQKVIQVGTGGIGAYWCRAFLPDFVEEGRLEVVAAVDTNAEALEFAREGLGLEDDRLYTDLSQAIADHEADFLTVVVPPAFHEDIVDAALENGLDILSEKPIADTLATSVRIVDKVQAAGTKMIVTMTHRFDQDKVTFRDEVLKEASGQLDYLVCRFTSGNRALNSWGAFRHQMADPMLIEGGIHQLDILADLAGAPCRTVNALTWNPPWGEYAGDSEALVLMEFENDVRAFYEGAKSTAIGLNSWGNDYLRAECENETIVLDRREVVKYLPGSYDADGSGRPIPTPVPLKEGRYWAHQNLIEQFLDWREGGPTPGTEVSRNLHSTAIMFAAIQSSRRRQTVEVAEVLEMARADA
ncbi:MAG: Gfo/Idh/MocA family oxidoreductase [Acidimicrobiia bacterium]|nr:Gfo/Idh/MocA family oxidoreductase [Acidimicrobiia bacterium]